MHTSMVVLEIQGTFFILHAKIETVELLYSLYPFYQFQYSFPCATINFPNQSANE